MEFLAQNVTKIRSESAFLLKIKILFLEFDNLTKELVFVDFIKLKSISDKHFLKF
jgi:hypothetical protein